MSQTIEVLIRVRPSASGSTINDSVNGNVQNLNIDEEQGKIYVPRPKNKSQAEFTFTKVYGPSADQRYVYSGCNVTDHILNGINCCIMTYGQTNTGKTYTMYGKGWENSSKESSDPLNLSNKGINLQSSQKLTNSQILPTIPDNGEGLNDDQSITSNFDGNGNDSDNDSIIPMHDPNKDIQQSLIDPLAGSESLGIIPRSINDLFDTLDKKCEEQSGFTYSVSCQILQIYNEKIYDLLNDKKRRNPLPLREFGSHHHGPSDGSSVSSVYVRGISVYQIDSKEEAVHLIKKSMKNKAIRATDYNNVSSRSHTVVQFFISIEEEESEDGSTPKNGNTGGLKIIRRSTLSLIDLAGSEKWRPSLSVNGIAETEAQVKEMTNINTSLHVLGNCIAKLIENTAPNGGGGTGGNKHIPFRDSVLTRLLQNTLSGNGKSIIVATIHSDIDYMEENYSTLQFANRASKVKVTLTANVGITEQVSLSEANKHIKLLQKQLQELKVSHAAAIAAVSARGEKISSTIPGGGNDSRGGLGSQPSELASFPMTVTVQECSNCEGMNEMIAQLQVRVQQLEQDQKKAKEKSKKYREQIQQLQEENYSLQQQLQHNRIAPPSMAPELSLPPNQSVSGISNNPNGSSLHHPSHSSADHPDQQSLVTSDYSFATTNRSITSIAPPTYLPDHSSVGRSYSQTAFSANPITGSTNSLTSTGKKKKSKVKSGKCPKHGLEDCVLCSMFGNTGEDNETEEDIVDQSVGNDGGHEDWLNDRDGNGHSSYHPYKPLSASSGPTYPVPSSSSSAQRSSSTLATPLLSERKPMTSGSDQALTSSRLIITPMTGEKPSSSRLNSATSENESSFNLCKTHALRNCLLCANEFTFQRELQFTQQLESLTKKTNAVLSMSHANHKLTPLYEQPGHESTSTATVSTIATLDMKSQMTSMNHYPHNDSSNAAHTTGGGGGFTGGFISTLDSLESSQAEGFSFPMKSSSNPNKRTSNASSLTTSQVTLKSNPPPLHLQPLPSQTTTSNSSPNDVAKAALLAANSILNSKEFSESQLSSFLAPDISESKLKSKRLRELKALSAHSMGNATSPAILEGNLIQSQNPHQPLSNNHSHQISGNAAILPRRSSTSPAPNQSIPIEPIHQSQLPYQPRPDPVPTTFQEEDEDDDYYGDENENEEDDDEGVGGGISGMESDDAYPYTSSQGRNPPSHPTRHQPPTGPPPATNPRPRSKTNINKATTKKKKGMKKVKKKKVDGSGGGPTTSTKLVR